MSKPTSKEIIQYFRSNIFEALSAYTAWKILFMSKSNKILPPEIAERYVQIQNYHKDFFISAERAFLVNFVMKILHPFDNRTDSYSLYKINSAKTELFLKRNKRIYEELKKTRCKFFAHKDIKSTQKFQIPSIDNLDVFFKNLIKFYNNLSNTIENSSTSFKNAEEIKFDLENLFMNLYRGENIRKKEIEIKWHWENYKKISDIL